MKAAHNKILALIVCALLAACGGGDEEPATVTQAVVCGMPDDQRAARMACPALVELRPGVTTGVRVIGTVVLRNESATAATVSRSVEMAVNGVASSATAVLTATLAPGASTELSFDLSAYIRAIEAKWVDVGINTSEISGRSFVSEARLFVSES